MTDEKIRENRLRRMAKRQGLELHKSRQRDPRGLEYGKYALVGPSRRGSFFEFTLDGVEDYLTGGGDDG